MADLILHAPFDGWLIPLEEVPDPVFAARMLGGGVAVDPLGEVLHAPADGEVSAIHEAGHAITLKLAGGVELLLHFGLESVALAGRGFAPLVNPGDLVRRGDPLLRVDVNAVAGQVKSLVTPLVLTELNGHALTLLCDSGPVSLGMPILALAPGVSVTDGGDGLAFSAAAAEMVRIPLAHGLHARPAARLADQARQFEAEVRLRLGTGSARLRSPSAVMALGAGHGDTVAVEASGPDAAAAVAAIAALIAGGMGEGAPFPAEGGAAVRHRNGPPAVSPAADPPAAGSVLTGVCAAPGLAVGPAWFPTRPEPRIRIEAIGAEQERALFAGALAELAEALARDDDPVFAAHRALLEDEDILVEVDRGIAAGYSAARAWRETMQGRASALRQSANPLFAERAADLDDLELRLQWQMSDGEMPIVSPPEGAIVIAADLMPSEVAGLDPARVGGLALARGGPTSHAAIIAAGRGLPALAALGDAVLAVSPGAMLALDADAGTLHIDPSAATLAAAVEESEGRVRRRAAAVGAAALEGWTADRTRIEVFANLGNVAEAEPALAAGAEGCGLLRTEFLFLDRSSAPDEAEQAEQYAAIARALDGRPLIVRLLDIGGDKPAPYLPIGPEENPALGLRGIRVGLAHPEVLGAQLRAILRAGDAGDLRIMAPMIARMEELRAVRAALLAEAAALGRDALPLGVMVETPAAALLADHLAAECDFLSIGTNDLTQYVLAMDRGNPAIAAGVDGLSPSVLRMIGQCCDGAARHGKPVGVCGGLASDPLAVPLLIGLGVRELSTAPAMLAEVKAVVRTVDLDRCRDLASRALDLSTGGEVRTLARAFAQENGL